MLPIGGERENHCMAMMMDLDPMAERSTEERESLAELGGRKDRVRRR